MLFKVLLILSIVLQFASTSIAIKLTRRTKFNSAWILFAIAMLIVNSQLIYELVTIFKTKKISYYNYMVWSTIVVSLCLTIGVFYLEKIISYIEAVVRYRRMYERKVITSMISAEERERQRIAKELHDGLGPLLSSAKMSISYILKPLDENESEETKKKSRTVKEQMLDGVEQVIDESIKSVREISNNLSPNVLNNFGLVRAVTNFINKLPLPPHIKILFDTDIRKERFGSDTEIILYRVCCELINNSIKHSECTRMKLTILCDKDNIYLTFADNGKGFDYEKVMQSDKKGLGLSNIVSRIEFLGGTLEVNSVKDKGTVTYIKVKKIEI